jgi:hypothetical protein
MPCACGHFFAMSQQPFPQTVSSLPSLPEVNCVCRGPHSETSQNIHPNAPRWCDNSRPREHPTSFGDRRGTTIASLPANKSAVAIAARTVQQVAQNFCCLNNKIWTFS